MSNSSLSRLIVVFSPTQVTPEAAACVRMHAAGVNVPDPTVDALPTVATLQPAMETYNSEAATLFAHTSLSIDMERRAGRCALDLAAQLWRTANKNGDAALTPEELAMVVMSSNVVLQMDRRFQPHPTVSMQTMLDAYSYTEFMTYAEFQSFVYGYFVISC